MKNLTLYTMPQSRGTNVLWMLEECGARYDTVALSEQSIKSPEYLAINPLGKVPALRHGNHIITETAAIITYLAEQFPDKQLIPDATDEERGQYYRWLLFSIQFEYAARDKQRNIQNNEAQRSAVGYGDFDTAFDMICQHIGNHEYMVGNHFSALDIYYGGLLTWFTQYARVFPANPILTAYFDRLYTRPAFQQAQTIDQKLAVQAAQ
ncbi:glutathione S-transferase family protein [Neisseria montereyensis]|uniref:Glutathione S-transferase family protein n=1 Tax=Neisseria montereyensis TaxID=2973938 RepID=A0ABT2FE14_9NEIS|nr:glutathione S-transferase family protein [Neisseria montereyensis]MCS4534416.1 glutathione S-transferase family protein [Neisseria montereyensis]